MNGLGEEMNRGGGKGDEQGYWENGSRISASLVYDKEDEPECYTIGWDDNKDKKVRFTTETEKQSVQINNVDQSGWEKVTMTVDSGSVDHVVTEETATQFPLVATEASKRGINFVAANGTKIINHGERQVEGMTTEFSPIKMTWQVARVKRNLASVDRMMNTGNRVVFDSNGSYIQNKTTGYKTDMRRNGRLTEFNVWIKKGSNVNGVTSKAFEVPKDNMYKQVNKNDDKDHKMSSSFTRLVNHF